MTKNDLSDVIRFCDEARLISYLCKCPHLLVFFLLYSFQGQWEDSICYTGPSISYFCYVINICLWN